MVLPLPRTRLYFEKFVGEVCLFSKVQDEKAT